MATHRMLTLIAAVALAGAWSAEAAGKNSFTFQMVPSSDAIRTCLPNASANVTIEDAKCNQIMTIEATGLAPNTEYDLFVIQVPHAKFGIAWYQSDLETNKQGAGKAKVRGIFSIETFSISQDTITTNGRENTPQTGATFGAVNQYHLGLWFNDPQVPFDLGCEPGAMAPTVTPFNGEQHAGIQVLNTSNFDDNDGPLRHFPPSSPSAVRVIAIIALVVCSGDVATAQTFRTRHLVRQVSQDPFGGAAGSEADTQVEPDIAIDPSDPSIVVAVVQEGRFDGDGGAVDIGFATSHDGGATWTTGSLPGLTVAVGGAFERASDPAVAIARDGAVYAQSLVFDVSDCRSAVAVQRSDDGGLTFGSPVLVHEDCTVFNDKTWIGVDTFPASPHYGRLYSAWDLSGAGAPIVLSHSDDRGVTWSPLVTVNDASVTAGIGALPLVQPNGDVTVVYEAYNPGPAREVSQTSHDGGAHFDAPVTIGTFEGIGVADMRTGIGLPAAAADPVTGDLYVVWPDARFRSDGFNDIVLGRSTDGGATWEPLRAVNQDTTARPTNHFTPAVAAGDGSVIVTYRSRRAGSLRVDTRWAVSADGGVTFGRARKLGRPADVRFAATSGGAAFFGDYMGVALSGDVAHAVWCNATRPRVAETHHQTTWSATIVR